MNRRECLKILATLGASFVLPSMATAKQVDKVWRELQSSSSNYGLDDHPHIVLLGSQVRSLPVPEGYKNHLLSSIDIYRDQLLERPEIPIDGGWDDFEALQQVTLGDMLEARLLETFGLKEEYVVKVHGTQKQETLNVLTAGPLTLTPSQSILYCHSSVER
jgi:hypothetical protein